MSRFPPAPTRGLGTVQKPETRDPQEPGCEFPSTTPPKPAAAALPRGHSVSGSSWGPATRIQLSSLENGLRLGLQEHLVCLENAQRTAQDGRALGLPGNFLWAMGQGPGDQAGMSWERLWPGPNGTSGTLVNVQTRPEVGVPRGMPAPLPPHGKCRDMDLLLLSNSGRPRPANRTSQAPPPLKSSRAPSSRWPSPLRAFLLR